MFRTKASLKKLVIDLLDLVTAPLNTTTPHPEMGATPRLPPYGGLKSGPADFVHLNAPPRVRSGQDHQLDRGAAPARAPHSGAPVLSVVPRENQIAMRQERR